MPTLAELIGDSSEDQNQQSDSDIANQIVSAANPQSFGMGLLNNLGYIFDLPSRGLRKMLKGRIGAGFQDWGQFIAEAGTVGFAPNDLFTNPDDVQSFGWFADLLLDPLLPLSFGGSALAKAGAKMAPILKGLNAAKITELLRVGHTGDLTLRTMFKQAASELFKHTLPSFEKNLPKQIEILRKIKVESQVIEKIRHGKLATMPLVEKRGILQGIIEKHLKYLAQNPKALEELGVATKTRGIPFIPSSKKTIELGEQLVEGTAKEFAGTALKGIIEIPAFRTPGAMWGLDQLSAVLPINTVGRLIPGKNFLRKAIGEHKDLRTYITSVMQKAGVDVPFLRYPVKFKAMFNKFGLTDLKYTMPVFYTMAALGKSGIGTTLKKAFTRGGKSETDVGAALFDTYMAERASARDKVQATIEELQKKYPKPEDADALRAEIKRVKDEVFKEEIPRVEENTLQITKQGEGSVEEGKSEAGKSKINVLPYGFTDEGLELYNVVAAKMKNAGERSGGVLDEVFQDWEKQNTEVQKLVQELKAKQADFQQKLTAMVGPEGKDDELIKTVSKGLSYISHEIQKLEAGRSPEIWKMPWEEANKTITDKLKTLGKEYGLDMPDDFGFNVLINPDDSIESALSDLYKVLNTYYDEKAYAYLNANATAQLGEMARKRMLGGEGPTTIDDVVSPKPKGGGPAPAATSTGPTPPAPKGRVKTKEGKTRVTRPRSKVSDQWYPEHREESYKKVKNEKVLTPDGKIGIVVSEYIGREGNHYRVTVKVGKVKQGFDVTQLRKPPEEAAGGAPTVPGAKLSPDMPPEMGGGGPFDNPIPTFEMALKDAETILNNPEMVKKLGRSPQYGVLKRAYTALKGEVDKLKNTAGYNEITKGERFSKIVNDTMASLSPDLAKTKTAVATASKDIDDAEYLVASLSDKPELAENIKRVESEIERLRNPKSGVPDTSYLKTLTKQLSDVSEGRIPSTKELEFKKRVLSEGTGTADNLKTMKEDARRDIFKGERHLAQLQKEYGDMQEELLKPNISENRRATLEKRIDELETKIIETEDTIEGNKAIVKQADYEEKILIQNAKKKLPPAGLPKKPSDSGPRTAARIAQKTLIEDVKRVGMEVPDWLEGMGKAGYKELPDILSEMDGLIAQIEDASKTRGLTSQELRLLGNLQDHKKNIEQSFQAFIKDAVEIPTPTGVAATSDDMQVTAQLAYSQAYDKIRALFPDIPEEKLFATHNMKGVRDAMNTLSDAMTTKNPAAIQDAMQNLDTEVGLLRKQGGAGLPPDALLSPDLPPEMAGGGVPPPKPPRQSKLRKKLAALTPEMGVEHAITDSEYSLADQIEFYTKDSSPEASELAYELVDNYMLLEDGNREIARVLVEELVSKGKFSDKGHREAWTSFIKGSKYSEEADRMADYAQKLLRAIKIRQDLPTPLRHELSSEINYVTRVKAAILERQSQQLFERVLELEENLSPWLRVSTAEDITDVPRITKPMESLSYKLQELDSYMGEMLNVFDDTYLTQDIVAAGYRDILESVMKMAEDFGPESQDKLGKIFSDAEQSRTLFNRLENRVRMWMERNREMPPNETRDITTNPWLKKRNAALVSFQEDVSAAMKEMGAMIKKTSGKDLPPAGLPRKPFDWRQYKNARQLSKEEMAKLSEEITPEQVREALKMGKSESAIKAADLLKKLGLDTRVEYIEAIENTLKDMGVDVDAVRAEFLKDAEETMNITEQLKRRPEDILTHDRLLSILEGDVGRRWDARAEKLLKAGGPEKAPNLRPDWLQTALKTTDKDTLRSALNIAYGKVSSEIDKLTAQRDAITNRTARQLINSNIKELEKDLHTIDGVLKQLPERGYAGADDIPNLSPEMPPEMGGTGGAAGENEIRGTPLGEVGYDGIWRPYPKKAVLNKVPDLPLDRLLQGAMHGEKHPPSKPAIVKAIEAVAKEFMGLEAVAKKAVPFFQGIKENQPAQAIKAYKDWIEEHKIVKAFLDWGAQAGFKSAQTVGFNFPIRYPILKKTGIFPIIFPAFHIRNALTFATQNLLSDFGNIDKGIDAILAGTPGVLDSLVNAFLQFMSIGLWKNPETRSFTRLFKRMTEGIGEIAWADAYNKLDDLKNIKFKKPVTIKVSESYWNARSATRPAKDNYRKIAGDYVIDVDDGAQFMEIAREHNAAQGFQSEELFLKETLKDVQNIPRSTMKIAETGGRLSMFKTLVEEGLDATEAASIVRAVFFDYSTISTTDTVVRALLPFGKYSMEAIPKTIESVIMRPGRNVALRNLPQLIGSDKLEQKGYGDELKITFAGGTVGIGVPTMLQELTRLGDREGVVRTLEKAAAQTSPILRMPLEMATGRSLYKGTPLTDWDWKSFMWAPLGRTINTINQMTGRELQGLVDTAYNVREDTLFHRWLPILTGLRTEQLNKDEEWVRLTKSWLEEQVDRGADGIYQMRRFITEPDAPESFKKLVLDYYAKKALVDARKGK